MEPKLEKRNEAGGERAVEKPLRGKVHTTDFFTSIGNPPNPRISTFPQPRRRRLVIFYLEDWRTKTQTRPRPRVTYRKPKMVLTMGSTLKIVLDDQCHQTVQAQGREFDTGITTPNGGLNAPLSDMIKWIGFLTGSANTDPPVLDRKSLMEMWNPVTTTGKEMYAEPASIGLKFFLFPRASGDDTVTFVGNTGHQAGFADFFLLNPNDGTAIIADFNIVAAWGEKRLHKNGLSRAGRV